MSRIGKLPIPVPSGVDVSVEAGTVVVKGPKGTLSHRVADPIAVQRGDNGDVLVTRPDDERASRALHGLTRSLIANMVEGVTKGFEKKLALVGVGFRAQAQGDKLNLTLGFSHPVVHQMPKGIKVATPTQTEIVISGIDKQLVGQVAAEVRAHRPPEPYKGKGVRYAGEKIRRKAGKAGKIGGKK